MQHIGNHHEALSRNLKALRAARGWSLDELAKRSGVSRAMIVQVEGTRTNSSLGTICQLADALEVPVQQLLATNDSNPVRVIRADAATTLWKDRRGSWARLLNAGSGGDRHELWQWRLAPGAAYDAPAHGVGTRETLWLHQGRIRVLAGDASAEGGPGDTIQFDAARAHRYENAGRTACEFSMIVHLPQATSGARPPMQRPRRARRR